MVFPGVDPLVGFEDEECHLTPQDEEAADQHEELVLIAWKVNFHRAESVAGPIIRRKIAACQAARATAVGASVIYRPRKVAQPTVATLKWQ